MNQPSSSSRTTTLLAFLAGAAIGAVVIALITPKKGSEVRDDLANLGNRMKGKFDDLAQHGSEAWKEVKKGAGRASAELEQGASEAAEEFRS